MGDTWLQHSTQLLSSDTVQGGGVYDLDGNPWAEKVSGFQIEQHEVALLAQGFADIEKQRAKARADAQTRADAKATQEACALAAGTREADHPLSLLSGQTDLLDEIKRAATVAVPEPELPLVPQIPGFTCAHFAGHGFIFVCGDEREMYFRRGRSGVACAKSLTGIVVGFHDEGHDWVGPCRTAVGKVAEALRRLGF